MKYFPRSTERHTCWATRPRTGKASRNPQVIVGLAALWWRVPINSNVRYQ